MAQPSTGVAKRATGGGKPATVIARNTRVQNQDATVRGKSERLATLLITPFCCALCAFSRGQLRFPVQSIRTARFAKADHRTPGSSSQRHQRLRAGSQAQCGQRHGEVEQGLS